MIRYLLFLSLPLYLFDQGTKWLILQRFPNPESPDNLIEVLPGFFNLVRVHNTGMAFGVLNGSAYANWIFGGIGLLAMTGIVWMWSRQAFPDKLSQTAASLLIAGILGNLTDRLLPGRGYVVDFLDFKLPFYDLIDKTSKGHFPSFNIADSCICVAAGLLVIAAFRHPRSEPKTSD